MSGGAVPEPQIGAAVRRTLAGPHHRGVALRVRHAEAVMRSSGLVGDAESHDVEQRLWAELFGAGAELQGLLDSPEVSDVLVNGPSSVWVDRGRGMERVGVRVPDVRALAVRLAAACGRRLDDAAPVVDGRLPDGSRLHAVLPPLAADGPVVSLRTVRPRALTLDEWRDGGVVCGRGLAVLKGLVAARANVLVSGATGSGKTTLLASMLGEVGHQERIVVIEEARELAPDHPHVVRLQSRQANVQGAGEVGLASLVRAALRMRPDRLVLGECRGPEVREVLAALNTGHDGGLATVHANATRDVPSRLVALGALAGMTEGTVAAQAVSALDAVLHLRRRRGVRTLVEIAVFSRGDDGRLETRLAASRGAGGELMPGPGWSELAERLDAAEVD